jgi:hypothetical protein
MGAMPQKKFNVRFQAVQGKNLLVQHNSAYEVDEVGLSIWELCDGGHSIEKIAEALAQEYEVEYTQALADCQTFIEELTTQGLLQ